MSFWDIRQAPWRRHSNAAPLRGRVHKVSIVAGGEVSVVVRFGLDEPRARELNQGKLLGLVVDVLQIPSEKDSEGERK